MAGAREKILDAADRIFREGGLEAVTTRRVGSEVGVTAMAIYKHFTDKDALVEALVERGFGLWEQWLAAALAAPATGSVLESVVRAYRDFALEEPRYFELMFLTVRRGIPDAREALRRTPSPSFNEVIVRVQQEIDAGRFRVRDSQQLILLMWAVAHGLVALHFTGRFSHDANAFRQIYDTTIATMLGHLTTAS